MKLTIANFRGEAPRIAPHQLPDNGAQQAMNCRLQSGDLESWRQFLLTKTLANTGAVQTVYQLNGAWLSWNAQVDVARGVLPGDTTFRTFLTAPSLYATPRYTTYALATTGAEPFPVTTLPLGVPEPVTAPTLVVGVDATPTTFSVDVTDPCDDLATNWIVSPKQNDSGDNTSLVFQRTTGGNPGPCFELDAQNNTGNPAYGIRDFGVGKTTVATMEVDVNVTSNDGNSGAAAAVVFGVSKAGSGCYISFGGTLGTDLNLRIGLGLDYGSSGDGSPLLATAVCTGAMTLNAWYTIKATKTTKPDFTSTVVAKLFRAGVEVGTVTTTNNFDNEGYCGFAYAKGDDRYNSYYDNFHVTGSGSTNFSPVNTATAYLYTFINNLGEGSAPSPPSAVTLRPDGVSITVTTPTTTPAGTDPLYNIVSKRIYREVTGTGGTVAREVVTIPLARQISSTTSPTKT